MAKLGQSFEAERTEVGLLADGWYNATITGSELKDTKDYTGKYINLQWTIIGPTAEGRCVFEMINIRNKSDKAQSIGIAQLQNLLFATGSRKIDDDQQLIGLSCQIKVGTQPAKDGYDAKNTVKDYKALEGGAPKMPIPKKQAVPNFVAASVVEVLDDDDFVRPW